MRLITACIVVFDFGTLSGELSARPPSSFISTVGPSWNMETSLAFDTIVATEKILSVLVNALRLTNSTGENGDDEGNSVGDEEELEPGAVVIDWGDCSDSPERRW